MIAESNRRPLEWVPAGGERFQVYTERHLDRIPQIAGLDADTRREMRIVSSVLPFRVNQYVLDELIDWRRVPDDPIYRLTFPQRGMLQEAEHRLVEEAYDSGDPQRLASVVAEVRARLNPHPAGQQEHNVPELDGRSLPGMQHKYRETVLYFPSQGQTCHSYCTFCFRWAQFVGDKELKFASSDAEDLHAYLRAHPEVSDVLVTGGDPLVMRTRHLARILEPLMRPEFDHVRNLRIGSKSLTFWPHRFLTDPDADDLLRLLGRLSAAGKHVAFMAHLNHHQELSTDVVRAAIRRIRDTGAVLRAQGPLIRWINDDAEVWERLWTEEVELGIIPYYMFVERNTGAKSHFEVPLAKAFEIYSGALRRVSGLARTARGPSMSAAPGKVQVDGVTEVAGERVFALRFLQGRNPDWVGRPFFARFDPRATWLDDLRPAFGESRWFWQDEFDAMCAASASEATGSAS